MVNRSSKQAMHTYSLFVFLKFSEIREPGRGGVAFMCWNLCQGSIWKRLEKWLAWKQITVPFLTQQTCQLLLLKTGEGVEGIVKSHCKYLLRRTFRYQDQGLHYYQVVLKFLKCLFHCFRTTCIPEAKTLVYCSSGNYIARIVGWLRRQSYLVRIC